MRELEQINFPLRLIECVHLDINSKLIQKKKRYLSDRNIHKTLQAAPGENKNEGKQKHGNNRDI